MINNDSVVTAYDEHLTLVEWLQKVEVLVKNGGLKETTLNDEGSQYNKALFSLTLTFNDGSTIKSNAMSLDSVNEALTALNNDIDDLKKYKGYQPIVYDKSNCVRIGGAFNAIECKLRRSDNWITLSENDFSVAHDLLLKAVHYGFVVEQYSGSSGNRSTIIPLINVTFEGDNIDATFGVAPNDDIGGIAFSISLMSATKEYKCSRIEI